MRLNRFDLTKGKKKKLSREKTNNGVKGDIAAICNIMPISYFILIYMLLLLNFADVS